MPRRLMRIVMNEKALIGEFLDEIEERAASRFKGKLHQAFVEWYVEAEYGKPSWDFTDDAGDGGIDAVVWRPEDNPPVVIIQSKFTENVSAAVLPSSAHRSFN